MSLFDLQDVCMVIGSLATLDLPMIVDLIVIFELKGPYYTLTMTDLFLQALSVIPRGSWGIVARRLTKIRWIFLYDVASLAPADLSSSAEHDVVTNDIIIDGPLRCSSWFSFDVPADPSSSSSACSWFLSFQLIHYAPAGSTWPLPDFEHLT
ncbi:callose synthase 10-like [Dorcoceras hygrometricum]|uniref:Callose synthase 10-like n=1 Tax=Dorcoceras hygrometricum TaxID=472368 RepID=A0A2Z7CB68_9LAMI|nr:callose synthase 10-like [Dorcoceras hygrometricum]